MFLSHPSFFFFLLVINLTPNSRFVVAVKLYRGKKKWKEIAPVCFSVHFLPLSRYFSLRFSVFPLDHSLLNFVFRNTHKCYTNVAHTPYWSNFCKILTSLSTVLSVPARLEKTSKSSFSIFKSFTEGMRCEVFQNETVNFGSEKFHEGSTKLKTCKNMALINRILFSFRTSPFHIWHNLWVF